MTAVLTDDQQAELAAQGFVRVEGFADAATYDAMLERVVELVHRAARGDDIGDAFVMMETQSDFDDRALEDRVAKVFRTRERLPARAPGLPRRAGARARPDRRPGAQYGYVEIVDHDMAAAVPVLMQPGDLLLFDSHLMHRSTDNESTGLRAAMVYHYAPTGTVDRTAPARGYTINDWIEMGPPRGSAP